MKRPALQGQRRATARWLAAFALVTLAAPAFAHEVTPPQLKRDVPAAWPEGYAHQHDVIVALVLTVGPDGKVEDAVVEAGVGEPLDSAAIAAGRQFEFEPARDVVGPRRAKVRAVARFRGQPAAAEIPLAKTPAPPAQSPAVPARAATPTEREPGASRSVAVDVRGMSPARSASSVTLDRRVLRAAPHKNASELLLAVPGVFVSQHSGEGKAHQIFFRGFDAVHGQDVELWVAGAPVNEVSNIHGQGYADLHFVIPEVVREIESSPGTYDPRQGDFAVAGTLRYTLGYGDPGVTAKASAGNFGSRRLFMAYRPKGTSDQTFGAFELYKTDGFGPSRAARHGSAIGQAEYDLGSRVKGRLMASTYAGRFDSAGVLRLDDIERGVVDRFATYDDKQGGYSSRTQLVAELRREGTTKGGAEPDRLLVRPYVVLRSLELRSNFTGYLTSNEGDSIQQRNDATTAGAVMSYRWPFPPFGRGGALEAGVSLRTDSVRQSQHRLSLVNDRITDDEQTPGTRARVRATDAAAHVDGAFRLLPRVALRGGLRADALSYQAEDLGPERGAARSSLGGRLSKRGTLDIGLLPGLNALFSYGEGFRSPQIRSLGDGETTPFTRVESYEAGLRFRQNQRFEASVAAYRTALSDDLVFDQATARNELVPSTRRTGFSANLIAKPNVDFTSSTSFTYTRAVFAVSGGRYDEGDLLPYVPQFVVRSDIAYTPRLGRVRGHALDAHVGAGITYLGRRPLPYDEMGHDVLLVDAGTELRLGPFATGIQIFNLLGADWYDGEFVAASNFGGGSASLVPIRHVTVGPPRTFLWSLSFTAS